MLEWVYNFWRIRSFFYFIFFNCKCKVGQGQPSSNLMVTKPFVELVLISTGKELSLSSFRMQHFPYSILIPYGCFWVFNLTPFNQVSIWNYLQCNHHWVNIVCTTSVSFLLFILLTTFCFDFFVHRILEDTSCAFWPTFMLLMPRVQLFPSSKIFIFRILIF